MTTLQEILTFYQFKSHTIVLMVQTKLVSDLYLT